MTSTVFEDSLDQSLREEELPLLLCLFPSPKVIFLHCIQGVLDASVDAGLLSRKLCNLRLAHEQVALVALGVGLSPFLNQVGRRDDFVDRQIGRLVCP